MPGGADEEHVNEVALVLVNLQLGGGMARTPESAGSTNGVGFARGVVAPLCVFHYFRVVTGVDTLTVLLYLHLHLHYVIEEST